MKLQFDNRVYDILKWLCLIALPVAFVGALIGISSANYKKNIKNVSQ